jgi:hypothetical protein
VGGLGRPYPKRGHRSADDNNRGRQAATHVAISLEIELVWDKKITAWI